MLVIRFFMYSIYKLKPLYVTTSRLNMKTDMFETEQDIDWYPQDTRPQTTVSDKKMDELRH